MINLPDTVFDYNKLPSVSLKFETSVLEPPEVIQSGPPHLIKGNTNLVYELGELYLSGDQGHYTVARPDILLH
jgi:hypothetical protein